MRGERADVTDVGINPTRTALIDLLTRMGADIRIRQKDPPEAAVSGATEPVADIEVYASKLRAIAVPESLVAACIDELPGVLYRGLLRGG